MAVITTSGSMPFSFARASIVCISGFAMFVPGSLPRSFSVASTLKFHFQIRARDDADRYRVPPAIVGIHQHCAAGLFDAAEATLEVGLPVHCLPHHQLGPAAGEAPVIGYASQRPVESGR